MGRDIHDYHEWQERKAQEDADGTTERRVLEGEALEAAASLGRLLFLNHERARRGLSLVVNLPKPNLGCLLKAEHDEPMFTLLARDPMAPALVRLWAEARGLAAREQRDGDKANEAMRIADDMERWAGDHPDHGFLRRLQERGDKS